MISKLLLLLLSSIFLTFLLTYYIMDTNVQKREFSESYNVPVFT